MCLEYPHKLSIRLRCKLEHFLSRGQNISRCSIPVQKIRGLLESSLDAWFAKFPVRQKIAQVGWAVPSNCEAINVNVIALIICQVVERRLTLGACYTFVPELLDGVVREVEKEC